MKIELVESIIIGATSIILVWDLYLHKDKIEGNTISQIVIKRSKENAAIPLLIGALIGHWFL